MLQYRNVHLWLLIPFGIVLLGFLPGYWLRFGDAPWRQHLHGLTATLWFCLLIAQPYLVTRGHVDVHRRYGMFALVLAGGVVLSALGAIPHNLVNERMPPTARYHLSFIDIFLISGFVFAVAMAVRTSRRLYDHARWMISTVFWAVPPAVFRLVFILLVGTGIAPTNTLAKIGLVTAGGLNLVVLAFIAYRDRRVHPAWIAAGSGSLVLFVPMSVGDAQWWRNIADALFTI